MLRTLLVTSIAAAAVVLPAAGASAAGAVGVFTPTVPLYTGASSSPCLTVKEGGASYNPSTGAWTVQPITVQFTSVSDCL